MFESPVDWTLNIVAGTVGEPPSMYVALVIPTRPD